MTIIENRSLVLAGFFLMFLFFPAVHAADNSELHYCAEDHKNICCGFAQGQPPCNSADLKKMSAAKKAYGDWRLYQFGCLSGLAVNHTTGLCDDMLLVCGGEREWVCFTSTGKPYCLTGYQMKATPFGPLQTPITRQNTLCIKDTPKGGVTAQNPVSGNLPTATESNENVVPNFAQGLHGLGNWFNSLSPLGINWNAVPGAMSGSLTPAMIGALGAFLGIALGAYTILPDGGFSWSGWPEGGTGPQSDDPAVPAEQVNGPGADIALFPERGTIDMVDPADREKVKAWLKNQVYFAGHWYVTDDGKNVASNFMLPDNPTPENTKIPIDELLHVDQFSARVPSDLHLNLAMQAAAQIPLDDLEKLRRGRWSTLPDSEREALLRRLAPVFGAPIHATDTKVDIWKPGLVRPEGAPTAPIPDYVPAQQYKINHGHGNFESHIELNSTNPGWKENRALNAVIMVGHELKHVQQGSVEDMEGYSPDDISTRNILVRQSYNSAYNPSVDPSRYAGNYIERDAQSYGTKLAAQISKRLRNPDTKTAMRALDTVRKAGTGGH